MIRETAERVLSFWEEKPNGVVVFPSQVAADYWARALISRFGMGTVRLDRVVSWDHFKEEVFRGDQSRRPANMLVRSLFAESFLAENARNPQLSRVLPREYAQDYQGFVQTLVRMVPGLGLLFSTGRMGDRSRELAQAIRETTDPGLWADWQLLYRRYARFLADHHYYEPRWLSTRNPECVFDYLIVFPQVLEDWAEYQGHLEGHPRMAIWDDKAYPAEGPSPGGDGISLEVFPNLAEEVGAVLDGVEQALEAGTAPEEMVLSLAGYESALDEVMREAQRRGLPLRPRRGKSLAGFPGPGLFTLLAQWMWSRGSLETTQALLKHTQIPWLRPELGDRLLALGVQAGLGLTDFEGWSWAVSRLPLYTSEEIESGLPREIQDWLNRLRRAVQGLTGAGSFAKVQEHLEGFLRSFIDSQGWSAIAEAALQRSREVLNDLSRTEAELGLHVPGPFRFWLARLETAVYVPQDDQGGISVYPYRVAAGVPGEFHCIMNMNQEDVTVTTGGLDFLREDQIRLVEGTLYRNLTEDFLHLYQQSGQRVRITCSRENHQGHRLPAGMFIAQDRIHDTTWGATSLKDRTVYEPEYRGVERWKQMQIPLNPLSPAPRSTLHGRLTQDRADAGVFWVSNAQLELFGQCPLAYLIRYGLGVEQDDWTAEVESPRIEGMLYHQVCEEFFDWLRREDHGIIDAGRLESHYLPKVAALAREVLRGGMAPGLARLLEQAFLQTCQEVLSQDVVRFDRFRVAQPEAEWRRLTSLGIVDDRLALGLSGRIDAVLLHPKTGQAVVVDYKRSVNGYTMGKIKGSLLEHAAPGVSSGEDSPRDDTPAGTDESGNFGDAEGSGESEGSMQLPLYALLVAPPEELVQPRGVVSPRAYRSQSDGDQDAVKDVCALVYLGFRGDKRYRLVYDRYPGNGQATIPVLEDEKSPFTGKKANQPLAGPKELGVLQAYILSRLGDLQTRIDRGDFAPSQEGDCGACRFRGVCRTRFGLQYGSDPRPGHTPGRAGIPTPAQNSRETSVSPTGESGNEGEQNEPV